MFEKICVILLFICLAIMLTGTIIAKYGIL